MKGLIKIIVKGEREIFINIDYIVTFKQQMNGNGTEITVTDKVTKLTIYLTTSAPEEIADMINLARS